MPRKKQTTHASGLVEVKATVGKTLDGKRLQKSFYGKSKAEARRKADTYILEQELSVRTGDTFVKKEYTFGEWAEKWLVTYKKPNVDINSYRYTYENTVNTHLLPYFKNARLTDIRSVDVQAFFSSKTDMSMSMLGKMKMCLNGIFDTAIDNDLCYKNPCKKVSPVSNAKKHEKKVYTSEQIEIVKAASYNKMNEVILLLETGLRRGELLGLMWSEVDLENGIISVKRSVADVRGLVGVKVNPPKWNSFRSIPLRDGCLSLDILKHTPHDGEYVFGGVNGKPQSPNTWGQKLERFMQTLPDEVPRLTAHELRHTFGTDLRRRGVDIYSIQKIMGHRDIKMTSELYVHNELEELKKAVNGVR